MVSAFGPTSMVKNTNIDLLESFFLHSNHSITWNIFVQKYVHKDPD